MEFYSATKKNEILSLAGKWTKLENIILSEVSQAQKAKGHMLSLICGLHISNKKSAVASCTLSVFLVVIGRKVNLVLVIPSWLEADISSLILRTCALCQPLNALRIYVFSQTPRNCVASFMHYIVLREAGGTS
jgi:hypothetical protein